MDNAENREKLHATLKAELWKRELSNAENADKAVLTYSSAGLGFSLAFLKDFLPIAKAKCGWLLYCSWALFTLAIVITITSYIISQLGLKRQESKSERYYLMQDEEAFKEKNIFDKLTIWFNISSCVCFAIAVILTTLFVSINLGRATKMTEEKKAEFREAATIPSLQRTEEIGAYKAAPIPGMQQIAQAGDLGKGAPVPAIQPVPQQPQQQQSQQQQPAQGSTPKGGNKE